MIHFESRDFKQLIQNKKIIIPSYQRDYAWKQDNINELFFDLENNKEEQKFFLGSIIVQKTKKSKEIVLIDGQQRIRTIAMFFVFFEMFLDFWKIYSPKELERFPIEEYKHFFSLKDNLKFNSFNSSENWKKILDKKNDREVNYVAERDIKEYFKINIKNFNLIKKYFLSKSRNSDKDQNSLIFEKLIKISNTIRNSVIFGVVFLDEEEDPNVIFEKSNTNKVSLNEWDLLKNFLIMTTKKNLPENEMEQSKYEGIINEFPKKINEDFKTIFDNSTLINKKENENLVKKMEPNNPLFRTYLERVLLKNKTVLKSERFKEYKNSINTYLSDNDEKSFSENFQSLEKFFSLDKKKIDDELIFLLFLSLEFHFDNISSFILSKINEKTWNNNLDLEKVKLFTWKWLIIYMLNSINDILLPQRLKSFFFETYNASGYDMSKIDVFWKEYFKEKIDDINIKNKTFKNIKSSPTIMFFSIFNKINWNFETINSSSELINNFFINPFNDNDNEIIELKNFEIEKIFDQSVPEVKRNEFYNSNEWTKTMIEENYNKIGNFLFLKSKTIKTKQSKKDWASIKEVYFDSYNFNEINNQEKEFLQKSFKWSPEEVQENSNRINKEFIKIFKKLEEIFFN